MTNLVDGLLGNSLLSWDVCTLFLFSVLECRLLHTVSCSEWSHSVSIFWNAVNCIGTVHGDTFTYIFIWTGPCRRFCLHLHLLSYVGLQFYDMVHSDNVHVEGQLDRIHEQFDDLKDEAVKHISITFSAAARSRAWPHNILSYSCAELCTAITIDNTHRWTQK